MSPPRSSPRRATLLAAALLFAAACGGKAETGAPRSDDSAAAAHAPSAAPSSAPVAEPDPDPDPGARGDAEKGKALVATFQCARCHEGTGEPHVKRDQACFGCHQDIMTGAFKAPNKKLEDRWHELVADLKDAPTLTSTTKRFRRRWLTAFLLEPYDLRPHLPATMPRLAMTKEQARDLAAYLAAPDDDAKADVATLAGADTARGRKLFEAKGCPSCHAITGAGKLEGAPEKVDAKTAAQAVRRSRPISRRRGRRMAATLAVVAWITSPKAMKADTPMPELPMPADEVRDIAAFVLTSKLEPAPAKKAPERLPLLSRKVGFDEVSEHIFRRSCWHCHGEPDYAVGDGGPGNTGGLGFKPRGLSLTDYQSVASGYLDDEGERHSVFEKLADGTPRLLAAVLARHDEEAGHARADVRGMPLGYPAVSPEDVQLLATWIDQGRPR